MPRESPRAIFFDLDDTILDDSQSKVPIWQRVCGEVSGRVGGLDADKLLAALLRARQRFQSDPDHERRSTADLRAATVAMVMEALRTLDRSDTALAEEIADDYRLQRDEAVLPFPGAVDVLRKLRASGLALALLTNGPAPLQRRKIERFDLANHFDFICIEGEFGCGKPDERVYRAALDRLGVAPRDTWMVGDSLEMDVAGPMKVGIHGVWIDRHGRGLPQGSTVEPSRIIRSLDELLHAL